nr:hypothetical protein [uncultured Sphingobacterium sp.]
MKTNQSKKSYVSPKIEVTNVELEQGIAAASVSSDVQQSWDNADDDNRTIDW